MKKPSLPFFVSHYLEEKNELSAAAAATAAASMIIFPAAAVISTFPFFVLASHLKSGLGGY